MLQNPELRRFIYQTQVSFRKENIYGEQEHSTNNMYSFLWQPIRLSNPNIAYNKHENTCQKL